MVDNSWQRDFVEVIDQRSERLPSAWLATHATQPARKELGRAVHESGKGRVVGRLVEELIDRASEKVVLSSFLLADQKIEDALLNAASRGARVYVLLASEARLGKEEGEGEFDKKVLEQHKAMLQRLGGHVLFRSASHFHAKVVIIDPESRPAGLLLTANLTTEALERNEELAVALKHDEIADVNEHIRWAMWESAEHELVDPKDRFRAVRPLGEIAHPSPATAIAATTSMAHTLREASLQLIDSARSRIIVSSFGWDANHEVVRNLCKRAREGVDVTVLARVRPSSMPALLALAESGATILGFKWLHAKAIWTDREEAMVMSANLQDHGLDHGFELGVRLSGDRARELFERLLLWIARAQWRLVPTPTLGDAKGDVMLWQRGRLTEDKVQEIREIELGASTAISASDLVAPKNPVPAAAAGSSPLLVQELHYRWTVVAPRLAAKSKEVLRQAPDKQQQPTPYIPPVFREPSGRMVVAISSAEELELARATMEETRATAIVISERAPR